MGIDQYEFIRVVGKGSFGKVYLVKHKIERKHYCLKVIKLHGIPDNERKACKHEVELLSKMLHPNIVGFKDSFTARGGKELCIAMTYCDGGDLEERIRAQGRKPFKEAQILHWFVQIALGLQYMHDNRVLHRDLKTQNIFLLGNGRLVLGDLGISKVLKPNNDFARTAIGTPYYMSPELFKNKPYNHKSDVWALGCILYEMATRKHAFDAQSLNGLATKITTGKYRAIPSTYSRDLRRLVDSMLQLSPAARPSLPDILRKPFIKHQIYYLLKDITSRPSSKVGDGTMVFQAAAIKLVNGKGSTTRMQKAGNPLGSKQANSLRKQLEKLGLHDAVERALDDSDDTELFQPPKSAPTYSKLSQPQVKRLAREKKDALIREKEKKKAVENALEKLRIERETRLKERMARAEKQRAKAQLAQKEKSKKENERRDRIAQRKKAQQRIKEYRRKHDINQSPKSRKNSEKPISKRNAREDAAERQRVAELDEWADAWKEKEAHARRVAQKRKEEELREKKARELITKLKLDEAKRETELAKQRLVQGQAHVTQLNPNRREQEQLRAQAAELNRFDQKRHEQEQLRAQAAELNRFDQERQEQEQLRAQAAELKRFDHKHYEQEQLRAQGAELNRFDQERQEQEQLRAQAAELNRLDRKRQDQNIAPVQTTKTEQEKNTNPPKQSWIANERIESKLKMKCDTQQHVDNQEYSVNAESKVTESMTRQLSSKEELDDIVPPSKQVATELDRQSFHSESFDASVDSFDECTEETDVPKSNKDTREKILAQKEERRKIKEEAHNEALRVARMERYKELEIARQKQANQYKLSNSNGMDSRNDGGCQLDVQPSGTNAPVDHISETSVPLQHEYPASVYGSKAGNDSINDRLNMESDGIPSLLSRYKDQQMNTHAPFSSSMMVYRDETEDESRLELDFDENLDDISDSELMQAAESDDDIDERELELREELALAKSRCLELNHTLKRAKAMLNPEKALFEKRNREHDPTAETQSFAGEYVVVPSKAQMESMHEEEDLHVLELSDDDESSFADEFGSSDLLSPIGETFDHDDSWDSNSNVKLERTVPRLVSGGLKGRIQKLEEDCIRALGHDCFKQVYNILKKHLEFKLQSDEVELDNPTIEYDLEQKLRTVLDADKMDYWQKVDNLIFMQETQS